jgi:hypothetical protein
MRFGERDPGFSVVCHASQATRPNRRGDDAFFDFGFGFGDATSPAGDYHEAA